MKRDEKKFDLLKSAFWVWPLAPALSMSPLLIGPVWASHQYILFVPYSINEALWWWPEGMMHWKSLWWAGYAISGVLPALLVRWLAAFLTKKLHTEWSCGLLAWACIAAALTGALAGYIAYQHLPADVGFRQYWHQYYFYKNPVCASFCVAAAITFFSAAGGTFQLAKNLSILNT